jgi:predicted transcriptional regulator
MIDKTKPKTKKTTVAVSFRMDESLKNKWYEMAENDRRRPVNWFEVVIEEKWEEFERRKTSESEN